MRRWRHTLTPNIGMVSREADFSIVGLLCNSLEDAQVPYTFPPIPSAFFERQEGQACNRRGPEDCVTVRASFSGLD